MNQRTFDACISLVLSAAGFLFAGCSDHAQTCASCAQHDGGAGRDLGSGGCAACPDGGPVGKTDGGTIIGFDGGAVGPSVTSFTLSSAAGGTGLPFTLGLGFGKGAVPTDFTIDLPSGQIDVKRRWSDGSVKHAIVSGHVDLTAGQPRTIKITSGSFTGGGPLTCATIQAAAPAATVSLGSLGSVDLAPLLANPLRTWLSGPEVAECHYMSKVGSDPTLRVFFHVRLYQGGRIFIRALVDNGYLDIMTADKSYVPQVTIGGTKVFDNGGAALTHYAHTRFSAEGWIGGDPGVVPRHDTQALMNSLLVPNYWNKGATNAALDGAYQIYYPMQNGDWTASMGAPGYQPAIGLLPDWEARFFTSGADPRALAAVLANAKALGSYPIVWRSSADDLPATPSGFPTWTVDGPGAGGENQWGAGPYTWEVAHHPSGGYLAYLLTGEYAYLEIMQLQAGIVYLISSSANGSGTGRILAGQTRGSAWSQRTIGQLAAIGPLDSVTADFRTLTASQAANWDAVRQMFATKPIGIVYNYELPASSYGSPGLIAPWMENFFAATYGHISDLEPLDDMSAWNRVRDYVAQFPIGLLGDDIGYCFTHASEYNIKVADVQSDTLSVLYDSWAKVAQASYGGGACGNALLGSSGGAPLSASTGYYGNLMPAIAYAVDHGTPGAAVAWSRFTGATNWSDIANSGFDTDPVWGIVPRGF